MSNQCTELLAALRRQPLTPLEIQASLGILRAGARVWDLRKAGHTISTEMVTVPTRRGTARVARYAVLPESNNLDIFAHGNVQAAAA